MNVYDMFQRNLIDLNVSAKTEEELFELVGKRLLQLGYVNEGYINGLKERERVFPTGLITQFLNIALPHTDPQYVEEPFIFVARLLEPVSVKQMGDGQEIEVKDVFFLGIKDGSKQVSLLSTLMEMFMDSDFVSDYIGAVDCNSILDIVKNFLHKGELNYG